MLLNAVIGSNGSVAGMGFENCSARPPSSRTGWKLAYTSVSFRVAQFKPELFVSFAFVPKDDIESCITAFILTGGCQPKIEMSPFVQSRNVPFLS